MTSTSAHASESAPSAVVFRSAQVFDGRAFVSGARDVLVDGDRIAAVGTPGSLDVPAGAAEVDASEKTLSPGIIDCHVHLCTDSPGALTLLSEPFSLQFFKAVDHMEKTLRAGVTTVRDAGGTDSGVKEALRRGLVRGPRLKIAVTILSQTGGHGDPRLASGQCMPFLVEHPGRPGGVADGVEGVTRKARELFRAGADHIKICSTGGVSTPGDDPRHSQFSEAEIAAIVAEAEAQHTHVMSHAQGAPGIKNALRAGVRSIEHGIYLDDEAIDLMLEKDAFLVPTLQAPLALIRAHESGVAFDPLVVAKAYEVVDAHHASVSKAYEAGVRFAMGTDAGVGPHGENLEEISLMAGVGLSAAEALAASTSNAADLMGLGEEVGRISEGFAADLVLFDRDLEASGVEGVQHAVEGVWQAGVRV